MKFKDEFQRADLAKGIAEAIGKIHLDKTANVMEVCGTHTHAIARYGIRSMLPEKINLISGPGCPVCVTPNGFIDRAIAMSKLDDVTITTFGDLFRVPGSYSSLQQAKSEGADVRIIYSAIDALKIAKADPGRRVVFLGVGFETTAPTIAAAVLRAQQDCAANFFVLPGFKTLPNALSTLAEMPDLNLQGFIAPGHLSVITGTALYHRILEKYRIGSVVTGFEALDILEGIRLLAGMISQNRPAVLNEYSRIVKPQGNPKAMNMMNAVFEEADSRWRGLGIIPKSGLKFRREFTRYDAESNINVEAPPPKYAKGCICGKVLTGIKTPPQCANFATLCTPENPLGACMVSSEGACAAYYRYRESPAIS